MVKKLSGLQREVLHLYRKCIRVAYTKPKSSKPRFISYIRTEFGKYRTLPRKDFPTIEYLLRVGTRRLEIYSSPHVYDIH